MAPRPIYGKSRRGGIKARLRLFRPGQSVRKRNFFSRRVHVPIICEQRLRESNPALDAAGLASGFRRSPTPARVPLRLVVMAFVEAAGDALEFRRRASPGGAGDESPVENANSLTKADNFNGFVNHAGSFTCSGATPTACKTYGRLSFATLDR